jgi:hypothetical protein
MTLQEAYVKGLDDAETAIIAKLKSILTNNDDGIPFPNPKLETIRQIIKNRSDYHYNLAARVNNMGKSFKKKLAEDATTLDNSI